MTADYIPPTEEVSAAGPVPGEHAELSYAYEYSPAGRTVEVVSGPDADGMVWVRYVAPFRVSVDDLKFWGDEK